jgi:hypothetical protein
VRNTNQFAYTCRLADAAAAPGSGGAVGAPVPPDAVGVKDSPGMVISVIVYHKTAPVRIFLKTRFYETSLPCGFRAPNFQVIVP